MPNAQPILQVVARVRRCVICLSFENGNDYLSANGDSDARGIVWHIVQHVSRHAYSRRWQTF